MTGSSILNHASRFANEATNPFRSKTSTEAMKKTLTRNRIAAALAFSGALAAANAAAQSHPGFDRPLTLAPANVTSSGGGAGVDDEKTRAAALAKATLNPIASLISLPLQNNFDWGAGPDDDGFQYKLTVQPVIPLSLHEDWNVISRTFVPYVYQENYLGTSSQSGLADTVQSLFFAPVKPTKGGWIWGAGPVLQIPTAIQNPT